MRVRVVAFARIAELIGAARSIDLAEGARVREAWERVASAVPELSALAASTRIARNGSIVSLDQPLRDGDELALLPPFGGG
jgi:molybdopterin converting factor small subunit